MKHQNHGIRKTTTAELAAHVEEPASHGQAGPIGIAGLGLIGGAIAMALKAHGTIKTEEVYALDTKKTPLKAALSGRLIGKASTRPEDILPHCSLVFLCLSPAHLLEFMETNMNLFKRGALITDTAGIKGNIIPWIEKNLRPDLDYIPGHPMAGAEKGGFINARRCSFTGKNYILSPLCRTKPENLQHLKSLIHLMGFRTITETSPADHDRKIAFTSQLCHVIAAALVDCADGAGITRFGGGSFEDLTRIAMMNTPLWTELFIGNKTELLARIGEFETSLGKLTALIAQEDAPELQRHLAAVRKKRSAMGKPS